MWPTFFIPGLSGSARPDVVAYSCGYTNYGSNMTVSVPFPTDSAAGDLVIAYGIGANVADATTVTMDTGWKQMQRVDSGYFTGGVYGPLGWKILDGTEGANATFTFNNGSSMQQRVCLVTYRNINSDMPFGSWKFTDPVSVTGQPVVAPQLFPADSRPAIVTMWMGGNASSDVFNGGAPVDNGDLRQSVGFVATGQTFWGSAQHGLYHALYYPDSSSELENLLPYSRLSVTNSAWVKTNVTASDTQSFSVDGTVSRITCQTTGATAARKAIYQEVTLEAGQQYTFIVACGLANGGFSGYYIYLIADDGTNNWGQFFEANSGGYTVRNTYGTAPDDGWSSQLTATGTNQGSYICLTFTPTTTGTHKLWIGMSDVNGTPECTNYGGYYTELIQMMLVRGRFMSHRNHDLFITGSGTLSNVAGTKSRVLSDNAFVNGLVSAFELRRAGIAAAPVAMEQPDAGASGFENSTRTGNYNGSGATDSWGVQYYDPYWLTSSPAYPPAWGTSVPAKVYAEFTWKKLVNNPGKNALGCIDSRYPVRVTTYSGASRPNDYFYESDGTIIENGSGAGTFTTWAANDVMGVGINWTDHEITWYKNGTLIRTSSFSGDYPRWLCAIAAFNNDGSANTYTANLTGPFSYLPSGFSAFDWENA